MVERRKTFTSTKNSLFEAEEEEIASKEREQLCSDATSSIDESNMPERHLSSSSIDQVDDELQDKKINNIRLRPDSPLNGAAYNITDEKSKDTSGSILDEKDVPASHDVESPPLAGPNVMNVILVASECAPWSKTGNLCQTIMVIQCVARNLRRSPKSKNLRGERTLLAPHWL